LKEELKNKKDGKMTDKADIIILNKESKLIVFVKSESIRIENNLNNKKYTDKVKKVNIKKYFKCLKEMKKLVLNKRSLKKKKTSVKNLNKLKKIIIRQVIIVNKWLLRMSLKKKANIIMKE